MPFDAATQVLDLATDEFALYRQRRERAAAFWINLLPERLNMRKWECGSRACALGWLARCGIDGWEMQDGGPWPPGTAVMGRWIPVTPYRAAAKWFGLTVQAGYMCFGPDRDTAECHRRMHINMVTPTDVARTLLSLPYEMPTTAL